MPSFNPKLQTNNGWFAQFVWKFQEPQGCQKIHNNIQQINLMSYFSKIQSKKLVYTLIRAETAFDIDITSAHGHVLAVSE